MKKNGLNISKNRLAAGFLVSILALSLLTGGYDHVHALESGTLRQFERGDKLPAITLSPVSGSAPLTFTPGNGKPAVMMFFAIRPDFRKKRSLALLSTLSDMAEQFKSQIDVVGIYSDSQKIDIVKTYMEKSNINVRVYNDKDKSVYNKYGVFMMPLAILSDADGKLHEVIPYTYRIKDYVEGNIRFLLGEWDHGQLMLSLKPKEKEIKSEEEKEYIRRINYGRIMLSKKMYGQAVREFSNATKIMPNLITAHVELGFAHLKKQQFDASEASFGQALKINPESDEAISGLGLTYYGQRKIDSALEKLEYAFIAPNPRLEVIIALADIYENKGLNQKANRLNKLAVSKLMSMYEQRWK